MSEQTDVTSDEATAGNRDSSAHTEVENDTGNGNPAGRETGPEPDRRDDPGDDAPPVNGDQPEFNIKDCALTAIATGRKAQNLKELREHLRDVEPGCIYYHFWGDLLRPRFENPEFNNDFATWAHGALHDDILAERLGEIDPTEFDTLEDLRLELIETIEERLDELEVISWARTDQQFDFITSQIVVFDTGRSITQPQDLVSAVTEMSASSVFYHFIDARRRTDASVDDFRAWLGGFDGRYDALCRQLSGEDPYFSTLTELRQKLSKLFSEYFGSGDE